MALSPYRRERLRIGREQSFRLLTAASQTRRNWIGWSLVTPSRKAEFWKAHADFLESAAAWRRLCPINLPG
jgi:hypothetical protein